MSECSIREEIAQLVQEKTSDIILYDFTSIEVTDFEFVKCVNRRVRVPDGRACYDGDGLRDLYRSANICEVNRILLQIWGKYMFAIVC